MEGKKVITERKFTVTISVLIQGDGAFLPDEDEVQRLVRDAFAKEHPGLSTWVYATHKDIKYKNGETQDEPEK